MIKVVARIPMGKRPASVGRGLKEATAAICLIRHGDDTVAYGIGVLYPDKDHLYFAKSNTLNPKKLWMGMYAASKIFCLSDEMVNVAVAIADETITLDDQRFTNMQDCLAYGYSAKLLREETFAQKIPPREIEKIVSDFKVWEILIDDSAAKKTTEAGSAPGFYRQVRRTGTETLPLAV